MIRQDSSRFFVNLTQIVAISSMGGNYVTIKMDDGEKIVARKTLKDWETCLPESVFIRIHRSSIININFTKKISYQKDGTCRLIQEGYEEPFNASRRLSGRLKNLLK